MTAINTCQVVVGRLLELRIHGFEEPEDVGGFANAVKAALSSATTGRRLVLVADWRRCPLLMPNLAEAVGAMFRRNSPVIERNAVLHRSNQSTSVLQLFRIAHEAANPNRRVFTETEALQDWLADLLDGAERARLSTFLSDAP